MRILQGHTGCVRCVAYTPDGSHLVSGGDDRVLRLWDLSTGMVEAAHVIDNPGAGASVEALAISPDGRKALAGTSGGAILSVDASSLDNLMMLGIDPRGVRCLAYSPDSRSIAIGGWDSKLRLWDADKMIAQHYIPEATTPILSTIFTRSGDHVLAGGYDGSLQVFDRVRNYRRAQVKGAAGIYCLACSPSADRVAAGDAAGMITLYDTPGLETVAVLKGHTWTVYGVAYAPDGRTLLSGSADGTVRVWDAARGYCLRTYRWHTRWVTGIAVAPDGLTAAACSEDGTIVVWDLDSN